LIPTRLDQIAHEIGGTLRGRVEAAGMIEQICIDSRGASPGALFVALHGEHTDGHRFVADAFRNGATAAIVAAARIDSLPEAQPDWPLIAVGSPLRALQLLARWYRRETIGKVLAITGSNGKTIVKDALTSLLASQRIIASPGSYNSQLGLPLAVLSADRKAPLAVFEAGISQPGEMAALEEIVAPSYGILTNIGMAHIASFGSREAIAREKMTLFAHIPAGGWVLLPAGEPAIEEPARRLACPIYRVGGVGAGDQVLALTSSGLVEDGQLLELSTADGRVDVRVKTRSPDLIADLHFAASAAYLLGVSLDEIASTLEDYAPPPTRMEVWSSPEGIRIINDAYSADPISVHAALRSAALGGPKTGRKIFVFAGMRELGAEGEREHRQVGTQAGQCGFSHVFLVGGGELQGTAASYRDARPDGTVVSVAGPDELKDRLLPLLRSGDTVLFKGPRKAGLVRAARDLSGSIAQRCLWVDLAAISENLARFRRHCGGRAEILAMLKALAYGTDLVQLASWLSRLGIHHIGVSATGEGIAVRKNGVHQNVYVFLPDRDDLDNLLRYRLTPILYSPDLVDAFAAGLDGTGKSLDVHLKIDTGMHRLGVDPRTAVALARKIRDTGTMRLTGVCTHFAAADDPADDDFTRRQIAVFEESLAALRAEGFDNLLAHAANTAAAIRFPREASYNLIRVGLGLYGLYPSPAVRDALELELAVGVTSRIASIQRFGPGDSLGYNRTFTAKHDMRVGIIPFGYDDGLPWRLSGIGHVLVEGQEAPIVGRISMDQMQVDVTHIPGIDVGAEVLLYGAHGGNVIRPEKVAEQAGTITHELLVRLGRRVQRIFVEP
jgi:alanine racemase